MSQWQSQNYYQILEVAATAAEHEIHQAYERAKSTYSVDSPALYTMFTPQEAQALNRLIEEAYSVLGNQRLRSAYDLKLKSGEDKKLEDSSDKIKAIQRGPTQLATESGFGKTRFGTYKIDADFEREIASTNEFDGPMLKRIRDYKEVTLENISEYTRINIVHLKALEANDFTSLPAPVFVRGFLGQICKILGIDDSRVSKSFIKKYKNSLGKA